MEEPVISGIVLAAGLGTRFGGDKLAHEVDGSPLVCYAVGACLMSRLTEVVVVLPPSPNPVERAIAERFPREPRLRAAHNPEPERGLISSVKAGLRTVPPRCEAAMIVLGDMPRVDAKRIDMLIAEFVRSRMLVAPECGGVLRHPRVVPARLFGEFLALDDGDKGTVVFDRHRDELRAVPMGSSADYVDIDRPEDLDGFATATTRRDNATPAEE